MAYIFETPSLGAPAITSTQLSTQTVPPLWKLGDIMRAVDPTYGVGEFIYLKGVASTVLGSWVTYNADDYTTALAVAGATGPVAIAMSANVAGQYGWYQIAGKGIGKALTGYVDDAAVYLTSTAGSIDDAVVAGDLVFRAKGASAVGTPSTGLAEFEIERPYTGAAIGSALTENGGAIGGTNDGDLPTLTATYAALTGSSTGTANGALEAEGTLATAGGNTYSDAAVNTVLGKIENNIAEHTTVIAQLAADNVALRAAIREVATKLNTVSA